MLAGFLEEAGNVNIFGGIRRLVGEQVERSSAPEQHALRVLAVEREPLSLQRLVPALGSRHGHGSALQAIEALRRRSLVERSEAPAAAFTLQSVVLEYVTDRLVAVVADEIERGRAEHLAEQPLIQAQAKDYVRQAQERLIGEPILQRLQASIRCARNRAAAAGRAGWLARPAAPQEQGYGPGNVVNLLRLLRGDLRGLDLSRAGDPAGLPGGGGGQGCEPCGRSPGRYGAG